MSMSSRFQSPIDAARVADSIQADPCAPRCAGRYSRTMLRRGLAALVASVMFAAACDSAQRSAAEPPQPGASGAGPAREAHAEERVVLFVGTSLTAGYGLPEEQAFPARIEAKVDSAGLPFRVINAGISGETSAGALRRVDWLLRQTFDVLVLETGANDMLRGQEPDSTLANIRAFVHRARRAQPHAEIVLVGMRGLPNLGRAYVERFESIYPRVADEEDLMLVPFLLDGVAADPELNLPDGIHPNEAGQRRVAETVWRVLEPVLRERAAR
jgi:acyl-CoA thioesterase I